MKKLVLALLLAMAMVLPMGIVTAQAAPNAFGFDYSSSATSAGGVSLYNTPKNDYAAPTDVSLAFVTATGITAPYSLTAYVNDTTDARPDSAITWINQVEDGGTMPASFPLGTAVAGGYNGTLQNGDLITVWANDVELGYAKVQILSAPTLTSATYVDGTVTATTAAVTLGGLSYNPMFEKVVAYTGDYATGDRLSITQNTADTNWTIGGLDNANGPTAVMVAVLDYDGNLVDAVPVTPQIPQYVAPMPSILVAPMSLDFGSVMQGTAVPAQTVTITNNGNVALTGVSASFPAGSVFSAAIDKTSLAVGEIATVTVTADTTAAVQTWNDTMTISASGVAPVSIPATITITPVINPSYTVDYQNWDANGSVNSVLVPSSTDAYQLLTPTVAGWTFDGWYQDAAYTQPIAAIPAGNTVDPYTVYGKWTQTSVTYTVTIINADGNGNDSTATVDNSAAYTIVVPTGASGLFADAGFTTAATLTIPAGNTDNVTVYAQWGVPVPVPATMVKIDAAMKALAKGSTGLFLLDTPVLIANGGMIANPANGWDVSGVTVLTSNAAILTITYDPAQGQFVYNCKGAGSVTVQIKIGTLICDTQVVKVS
jgi:uncharacterized repeat protein (TIGR02543 family)